MAEWLTVGGPFVKTFMNGDGYSAYMKIFFCHYGQIGGV